MNNTERVCQFLEEAQTYYLATVDGDQPRVRPFGDDRREPKAAMLEKMPSLKAMYSADDDNTQVLYFRNATATFASFTEAPETFAL